MKLTIRFLKYALLLIFIVNAGASVANAADTPEAAAKIFYEWYLKELNRAGGNPIDNKQMIAKYATARLRKQIAAWRKAGEYDADYFINAQDFDENWQVATTSSAVKENTAILKVLLAAPNAKKSDWKQTLSVTMKMENGVWKIDTVS